MSEQIINGVIVFFLAWNGYSDWKKQEISLASVLLFGITGIGSNFIFINRSWKELACGAAVGVFIIIVAFLTKEAIGIGDGLILVIVGVWLGFWETLQLFVTGTFLCTAIMGGLILSKRFPDKDRIPLVPFFLLAYVGGIIV